MLLLYVIVLGLLLLVCQVPRNFLKVLLRPAVTRFGYVVEYAYSLRACALHVSIERFAQRTFAKRPYHSRCVDLRSELLLAFPKGKLFVHAVPCLEANYAYLLIDASESALEQGRTQHCGLPCCLVDPCDASAVVDIVEILADSTYAEFGGLTLQAVLCTHKHWDHAGGNSDLRAWARAAHANCPVQRATEDDGTAPHAEADSISPSCLRYMKGLPVYGGHDDSIPGRTHPLENGDVFRVGNLEFEALATPGHTVGSMVFGVRNLLSGVGSEADVAGAFFTGDCLFSGGCGNPFEGSELDMEHCFASILVRCDQKRALLFPGHEYTAMLLKMSVVDDPDSFLEAPPGEFLTLCADYYVVSHRRNLHDKIPSVPCTIAGEQQVNPIFRAIRQRAVTLTKAIEALENKASHETIDGNGRSSGKELRRLLPSPPVERRSPKDGLGNVPLQMDTASADMPVTLAGRSQRFAFLFRTDLEEFLECLRRGDFSDFAKAADSLEQLQQRPFEASVLTGEADGFDDEGIQEEGRSTELAEDRGGAIVDEDPTEETQDLNHLKKCRRELAMALKVLGVPAAVPIGRKAPCAQDKLPINVHRVLRLLRCLGVKREATLNFLSKTFSPYVVMDSGGAQACERACTHGQIPSQVDGALLPLEDALQLLCPIPPPVGLCARAMKRFHVARACAHTCYLSCCRRCNCRWPCRHEERAVPSPPATPEQRSARKSEALRKRERRLAIARREVEFSRHDLGKCTVCACDVGTCRF